MSQQIRYNVSIAAARNLLRRLGYPEGAQFVESLSVAAYAFLEAIYQAETELAQYACSFLCPNCFRSYRINVACRGREVRCVDCGHRWRAPDVIEPN